MIIDMNNNTIRYGVLNCKYCCTIIRNQITMHGTTVNICDDCIKILAIHNKILITKTDILREHI